MANPLYNAYGRTGMSNAAQIMQAAQAFKQQFKGNPQQKVQELLNSGQMSQAQFNDLAQQAQEIIRLAGGR